MEAGYDPADLRTSNARRGNRQGHYYRNGMTELFHITERMTWEAAQPAREYRISTRGVSLEEQGFIHCSLRHQLRGVAEFVYGDADDLVVLVIDSDRLTSPVRYEA